MVILTQERRQKTQRPRSMAICHLDTQPKKINGLQILVPFVFINLEILCARCGKIVSSSPN